MKEYKHHLHKTNISGLRLLASYLLIVTAPAAAVIIIYVTMGSALLNVQIEKVRTLQTETVQMFNRESDQIANLMNRIKENGDVRAYTALSPDHTDKIQMLNDGYRLAKNYADTVHSNRIVRNLYIFPIDGAFVLQGTQVIPATPRGLSTLSLFSAYTDYPSVIQWLKEHEKGAYRLGTQDHPLLLMTDEIRGVTGEVTGYVAVEIDRRQVMALMSRTLGEDEGIGAVTAPSGEIMLLDDRMGDGRGRIHADAMGKQDLAAYLMDKGLQKTKVIVIRQQAENGWSFISLFSKAILRRRIGRIRYVIMALCILSVLCGVGICMIYWYRSLRTLLKYDRFRQRYMQGQKNIPRGIWGKFSTMIDQIEDLQHRYDKRTAYVREGIFRRLLTGEFEDFAHLQTEAVQAGIKSFLCLPCTVVCMQAEPSVVGADVYSNIKKRIEDYFLTRRDLWYACIQLDRGRFTLLIGAKVKEENHDANGYAAGIKRLMEEVDYSIYSRLPVSVYVGISVLCSDPYEIGSAWEEAASACSYAVFRKLRIPVLYRDMPKSDSYILTVEMEMQLERLLRYGTQKELSDFLIHVGSGFLGGSLAHHNIELLRYVALRTLDEEPDTSQRRALRDQIHHVEDMTRIGMALEDIRSYFSRSGKKNETLSDGGIKDRLDQLLEERLYDNRLTLGSLAEAVHMPEKKLYREFKKMYGVSFSSYVEQRRLEKAGVLLRQGKAVSDVALLVGYTSDYSFRRAFKRVNGISPSEYSRL